MLGSLGTRTAFALLCVACATSGAGQEPSGPATRTPVPSAAAAAPRVISIVGSNDLHGYLKRLPAFSSYVARLRELRSDGRHEITMRLELVALPVSDVDRAKAFYVQAGFNADHDHVVGDDRRFVQLTPPGSACSIAIGRGVTDMAPGSVKGMQVVVDDIEAAHDALAERGVDVSDVQDFPWGRFVFFSDPDGNGWAVQQIVRPG